MDSLSLYDKSLKELKEVLHDIDDERYFRRSELAHKAVNQLVYRMDGGKIPLEEKGFLWNMIMMIVDHDDWFDDNIVQVLLRSALKRNNLFTKKQINLMFEWKNNECPTAFRNDDECGYSHEIVSGFIND